MEPLGTFCKPRHPGPLPFDLWMLPTTCGHWERMESLGQRVPGKLVSFLGRSHQGGLTRRVLLGLLGFSGCHRGSPKPLAMVFLQMKAPHLAPGLYPAFAASSKKEALDGGS